MKKVLLSILVSLLAVSAFSQAGIYQTYEDFLENRVMEEYSEYVSSYHAFGRFTITFLDEYGEEVKVKPGKYWGYRRENGMMFKFNKDGAPFYIVVRGALNVYTNYRSHFNEEGNLVFDYGGAYSPAFSIGDNGKFILLTQGRVKKQIKKIGNEEDLKLLKEAGSYPSDLMRYIQGFNERHSEKQASAQK